MDSIPVRKKDSTQKAGRDQSGIALFMVIAAMSVLSILVTEFVYVSQMSESLAFDAQDQLKAHYLAKSGLKLALLRLKAYQFIKANFGGGSSGGGNGASGNSTGISVPHSILDKIWSTPIPYPIPTNLPGMSVMDRDQIDKFQKSSGLEGSYSTFIESESSRYNLNSIIAAFAAPAPSPSPAPSSNPNGQPNTAPSAAPTAFDPNAARDSLNQHLAQLLNAKVEQDSDFASDYRDFKMDDFMDNLVAWADRTYQKKNSFGDWPVHNKGAPFYDVSELHMIQTMDDQLYNLWGPGLTASATLGININTMKDDTLKALIPQITVDEVTEFFKFRDSEDQDNMFKSPDDFYKYIQGAVGYFKNSSDMIGNFKTELNKRQIVLVVDENSFKIVIQAQVNHATRTIQAWVTLTGNGSQSANGPSTSPSPAPAAQVAPTQNGEPPVPDPGLKITFMRVL